MSHIYSSAVLCILYYHGYRNSDICIFYFFFILLLTLRPGGVPEPDHAANPQSRPSAEAAVSDIPLFWDTDGQCTGYACVCIYVYYI